MIRHLLKSDRYQTPSRTLDGRIDFNGLPISIETGRSRVRAWYDPHNDTVGMSRMALPYGYVRGTVGMDGDALDVFVGPDREAPEVYIVTTRKAPDFRETDEQKVFLGLRCIETAQRIFLQSYNDPRFLGSIKAMPFETFKQKITTATGRIRL